MAREPLRKEVDRRFRCINEDFIFTKKVEYLSHDAGAEERYYRGIRWVQVQSAVYCPNDPFHLVEQVAE